MQAVLAAVITFGLAWAVIVAATSAGPPVSLVFLVTVVVLGALWLAAVLAQQP